MSENIPERLAKIEARQRVHGKALNALIQALRVLAAPLLAEKDRKRWDAAINKLEEGLEDGN